MPPRLIQRYSDNEVLSCLQQTANGQPLSRASYDRARQGKRLENGRPWPSGQQAIHRWGSWNAALKQAGLPTNLRPHQRGSRWSDEAILDAVVAVAEKLGHFPSAAEYDKTAREDPALPSLSTIRVRFGWSAAVRKAR